MREPVWGGPGLRRLPERRIRKARFKQRDLRVLVDSVMERRRDIFGQGGRPPSLQSRRRAWIFVMERVNAVSGTRRSWEEVRKKVHDLKKSTKEKLAYNRRSRQLSGGGRPVVKALTEFENDMLALFGKETFEGFDPGDLAVTSQLSDQGETSGSSTIAANRRCTPEFQISSAHPEAGTSTGTPTAGDGSAEDEEALDRGSIEGMSCQERDTDVTRNELCIFNCFALKQMPRSLRLLLRLHQEPFHHHQGCCMHHQGSPPSGPWPLLAATVGQEVQKPHTTRFTNSYSPTTTRFLN